MTARLAIVWALVLLLSPAVASARQADWPTCSNFAATLSDAKQQYTPLCVSYTKSGVPADQAEKERYKIEAQEGVTAYKSLPHVRISNATRDAAFLTLVKRFSCSNFPMILICDGRGCVLGVQAYGTVKDPGHVKEVDLRTVAEQMATASAVVNWEKTVDGQLATVEAKIKDRRYAEVSALLAQIDAQDKKFTTQLAAAVPWQPADQHDPWFYAKEVKESREKLKSAIQKELDAAQALLAAGQAKPAQAALEAILFFKADADLAKKIAEFSTQVDRAVKSGVKPAASAAPAAAK